MSDDADICLIFEGSYPYVSGGVAQWAHELIRNHKDYTFTLVSILPPNETQPVLKYELPSNVTGLMNLWLQTLPEGVSSLPKEQTAELFQSLERVILNMQCGDRVLRWLEEAEKTLARPGVALGSTILMNSPEAWKMLVRMYHSTTQETSFLNFFWSWRCLLGSFFSIMLADIPKAKIYHSLCTGYAGAYMARAHIATGSPCLLTEHGIYTNERRIEVTATQWFNDLHSQDMRVDHPYFLKRLKDFWIDTFSGLSKTSYEAAEKIITLYEGNRDVQISEGADPQKVITISNGINYERFSAIERKHVHPPTLALIGRVVPIKDVKSFINAVNILKAKIPELRAWVLGGFEEDPDYYDECQELVDHLGIQDVLTFTGRVDVTEYLPEIDLLVLTSISEGQPLSILEGGAAGIPCITTNVGSCSEVVYGKSDEDPPLGPGGVICPLANPEAIAKEAFILLTQDQIYNQYSESIQKRVKRYYNKHMQIEAYNAIYSDLMGAKVSWQE